MNLYTTVRHSEDCPWMGTDIKHQCELLLFLPNCLFEIIPINMLVAFREPPQATNLFLKLLNGTVN